MFVGTGGTWAYCEHLELFSFKVQRHVARCAFFWARGVFLYPSSKIFAMLCFLLHVTRNCVCRAGLKVYRAQLDQGAYNGESVKPTDVYSNDANIGALHRSDSCWTAVFCCFAFGTAIRLIIWLSCLAICILMLSSIGLCLFLVSFCLSVAFLRLSVRR